MYEFGDHGNIVVVSSFMTRAPTDTVYFSIDDGRCFNKVQLEEAVYVENIRYGWVGGRVDVCVGG